MPKTAYAFMLAFAVVMPATVAAPAPAAGTAIRYTADRTLAAMPVAQRRPVPRERRAYRDGRKIACTPAGCHPIPLGCYPEPAYDFWGNPTGYDKIVCPRR